jgi:hypothetical protein
MYVGPDDAGQQGIFLYKDLPVEAGLALEKCLKKITPQIMVGCYEHVHNMACNKCSGLAGLRARASLQGREGATMLF